MQDKSSFDAQKHRLTETRVVNGPRMVRDGKTGEMISVVERRADGVAGARAPFCLVFSSEAGFRRIWNYPANWMDFGDDELLALSEPRLMQRSQSA